MLATGGSGPFAPHRTNGFCCRLSFAEHERDCVRRTRTEESLLYSYQVALLLDTTLALALASLDPQLLLVTHQRTTDDCVN